MKIFSIAKLGCGTALAAALAGCGGFSLERLNPWRGPVERVQSMPSDATAYACDGGKRLVVRYLSGENAAMIVFKEREFRLDQAPSASGARYTNGSTTLNANGDEAHLEEAGAKTYSNCRKAAA